MSKRASPNTVAIIAARIMRAYPSLSPYSAASLATELCAIERAQRRHAERCCNGDYDRSPNPKHVASNIEQGIAEREAERRIDVKLYGWCVKLCRLLYPETGDGKRDLGIQSDAARDMIELQGDPRGAVLLLRLPGEAEGVGV